MPFKRSAQVKPLWLLEQEQEMDEDPNPFYKNFIDCYFDRPIGPQFDSLTYF